MYGGVREEEHRLPASQVVTRLQSRWSASARAPASVG